VCEVGEDGKVKEFSISFTVDCELLFDAKKSGGD